MSEPVDFYRLQDELGRRRLELDIPADESSVEAMRNKGHRRTIGKKALIRATAERARDQGIEPPPTYVDGKRV